MQVRSLIAFAFAVLLSACASKSETSTSSSGATQQSGDFAIATKFAPDPPKQGQEIITVALKDAAGNPVKGAIVKIATSMPSMSMGGPTLTGSDNGDGTYSATVNLNFATTWAFDVGVKRGSKSAHAAKSVDVK